MSRSYGFRYRIYTMDLWHESYLKFRFRNLKFSRWNSICGEKLPREILQ